MKVWDKIVGYIYQIIGATYWLVSVSAIFFARFDIMFFCGIAGLGLDIYGTNKLRVIE